MNGSVKYIWENTKSWCQVHFSKKKRKKEKGTAEINSWYTLSTNFLAPIYTFSFTTRGHHENVYIWLWMTQWLVSVDSGGVTAIKKNGNVYG